MFTGEGGGISIGRQPMKELSSQHFSTFPVLPLGEIDLKNGRREGKVGVSWTILCYRTEILLIVLCCHTYIYIYIKKKMAEIIGNKNYSWPFCVGFSVIRFRAAVCHQQCVIWQNRWFPVGYGWLQIPPKAISSCLT